MRVGNFSNIWASAPILSICRPPSIRRMSITAASWKRIWPRSLRREYETGKDRLSDILVEMIERGQKVAATDYADAIDAIDTLNAYLNMIFEDYDAILTPSAPGEAPKGLESTGNPTFCTIWQLCGVPALNLPILQGPAGLPLGVQLVSHRGDDARLLRTARWLTNTLTG